MLRYFGSPRVTMDHASSEEIREYLDTLMLRKKGLKRAWQQMERTGVCLPLRSWKNTYLSVVAHSHSILDP